MANAYRVSYVFGGDGDEVDALGPPKHLICDETLGESLNRIRDLIQTWIENGEATGSADDVFRHLNISVMGPFPEERSRVVSKTPLERLAEASSRDERFNALGNAAKSQLDAGEFETARTYAEELRGLLPSFEGHWNLHHAYEALHVVFGRLALREGKVDEAKQHLLESAQGSGSPTMSSFGPNMSLARDLLLAGESETVLEYFDLCRKFWEMGSDDLDEWIMYVIAGRMPDFGANLMY